MNVLQKETHRQTMAMLADPEDENNDASDDIETVAECLIRREGHLATHPISCTFQNNTLVLRGWVPTYYLKQIAQTVAMRIDGVERVLNQIEVVAPTVQIGSCAEWNRSHRNRGMH